MKEFICYEDENGKMHLRIPVEEIVRCKDCEGYLEDMMGAEICEMRSGDEHGTISEGFCHIGRRRRDA